MVRPLRIKFAGALYHATVHGNAREDIYGDDADRKPLGSGLTIDITTLIF